VAARRAAGARPGRLLQQAHAARSARAVVAAGAIVVAVEGEVAAGEAGVALAVASIGAAADRAQRVAAAAAVAERLLLVRPVGARDRRTARRRHRLLLAHTVRAQAGVAA